MFKCTLAFMPKLLLPLNMGYSLPGLQRVKLLKLRTVRYDVEVTY